jgi:hypothetical protein
MTFQRHRSLRARWPAHVLGDLSQTLDYKNPQRRILARSDSLRFLKQRVRKLYRRLHMGVCTYLLAGSQLRRYCSARMR